MTLTTAPEDLYVGSVGRPTGVASDLGTVDSWHGS